MGWGGGGKEKKSRLSDEQKKVVQGRAISWRQTVGALSRERAREKGERGEEGEKAFFPEVFRVASELIERDASSFCDRAEEVFDEIEAHGQEPSLDGDWLGEVTGERDSFYFSTENLVSDLVSTPKRKRRKKQLSKEEQDRLRAEVEAAIIDEAREEGQSFEQAIAVAHAENVEEWIEKINKALHKLGGKADFWQLRTLTKLQPVELLLGLLLGQQHWSIRQIEFYGTVTIEAIV